MSLLTTEQGLLGCCRKVGTIDTVEGGRWVGWRERGRRMRWRRRRRRRWRVDLHASLELLLLMLLMRREYICREEPKFIDI